MRQARHSLVVTVALPCSEAWAQMPPTARGRHCAACAREVVDFTRHTDAELLAWFRQPDHAATCGRFRLDQLKRPLLPPAPSAPRWRSWLAALVALWAWREATPSAAPAQQHPAQHLLPRPVTLSPPTGTLRGQVFDRHTRLPLAGVMVQLDGTDLVTQTDPTGHFALSLPVPRTAPGRHGLLSFRLPYYARLEVPAVEAAAQPVFLSHSLPTEPLTGILGGARVEGVRLAEPESPKRGLPLLNLEDWLR